MSVTILYRAGFGIAGSSSTTTSDSFSTLPQDSYAFPLEIFIAPTTLHPAPAAADSGTIATQGTEVSYMINDAYRASARVHQVVLSRLGFLLRDVIDLQVVNRLFSSQCSSSLPANRLSKPSTSMLPVNTTQFYLLSMLCSKHRFMWI